MLSTSQERLLRYWGLNMAIAMEQSGGAAWPLFGYGKARFLRFALVAGAIFIPGCLLFIILDVNAGPLVDALKVVCAASTLGGMVGFWWRRPNRN